MFIPTLDPWRRLRQYDELPGADPEPVFPLPEDLSTLSDAELAAKEEEATALFDELRSGDLDAEAMAKLAEVRDAIRALRTEGAKRTADAEKARAELADMEAEVHPPEPDDNAGDEPEPDEPEPDEGEPEPTAEAEPEADNAPVPVAAGAKRRAPIGAISRHAPPPATRPGKEADTPIVITAASDIPGVVAGSTLRLGAVAEAMHGKARLLNDDGRRAPIATIRYPIPEWATVERGRDPRAVLDRVTKNKDDLAALTAAGGWCGPLTPLYSLFRLDAVGNTLDLPTVRVARQGISVPDPLLLPSDLTTLGFAWDTATDAAAVAGVALSNIALTSNVVTIDTATAHTLSVGDCFVVQTETAAFQDLNGKQLKVKTVTDTDTITADFTHANMTSGAAVGTINPEKCCIRIPCPSWTDYVLAADGVCVTHGNLADRSFPELTRDYINMVMNAHQIVMSTKALAVLDSLANAGGAATNMPEAGSGWSSFFNAIDLLAELYRETYHMPDGAPLEGAFPQWTRNYLRADLATRSNGLDPKNITDALIATEFGLRNIRPQYLGHYQALSGATAWPSTLNFLLWAPGSFVRGTGGTLDLGVVRDSTLNAVNDFTAAWTEEFWLIAQLGPDPMEGQVTFPALGCNTANCA